MKGIILSFLFFFFISCKSQKKVLELNGIELVKSSVQTNKCFVYSNYRLVKELNLKQGDKTYSGLKWENQGNKFLAIEEIENKNGKTISSNLVIMDTSGNVVETVIQSKYGEYIGDAFLSRNDKRIITTVITHNSGIENLFCDNYSFAIIDFNNRTVIKKMNSFYKGCSSIYLDESPWSPDEKKFVYVVSQPVEVSIQGDKVTPSNADYKKPGIYIYNIENNNDSLLIIGGHNAVWNQTNNSIAYIMRNNIWTYNADSGIHHIVYNTAPDEYIQNIHWTPDGNYLYIICPTKRKYNEKLIRVSDASIIPFKKLNIGRADYSWK